MEELISLFKPIEDYSNGAGFVFDEQSADAFSSSSDNEPVDGSDDDDGE